METQSCRSQGSGRGWLPLKTVASRHGAGLRTCCRRQGACCRSLQICRHKKWLWMGSESCSTQIHSILMLRDECVTSHQTTYLREAFCERSWRGRPNEKLFYSFSVGRSTHKAARWGAAQVIMHMNSSNICQSACVRCAKRAVGSYIPWQTSCRLPCSLL